MAADLDTLKRLERIASAVEKLVEKFSHIEDWLGELVTYLKRK